jgi:hypothetical protein
MKNTWVMMAACLMGGLSVQAKGVKICFEAETAERCEAPMAVVSNGIEGASGAYLEIPEGAGNPPKLEAGKAVFTVEVPEDGLFTLWCRVWWEGECSNSFNVTVDQVPGLAHHPAAQTREGQAHAHLPQPRGRRAARPGSAQRGQALRAGRDRTRGNAPMTLPRLHTPLRTAFRWGALLTLCAAPTQWTLIQNPRLGPADVLLAVTAGLWGLDILLTRDWRRLRAARPHWTHLLFVLCAGAAVFAAADKKEAVKELIQLIEYFIVGAMVFAEMLKDKGKRINEDSETGVEKRFPFILYPLAFILLLAAVQYFSPDGHPTIRLFAEKKTLDIIVNVLSGWESPLLVGGTFGNRNVLGGFLALALPLCFWSILRPSEKSSRMNTDEHGFCSSIRVHPCPSVVPRILCLALLLLGFTVNLSGASYWAVAGAIAAMAAARGAKWFIPVAAALVLWQGLVLPHLPRENDLCHYESVALYDDAGQPTRRYPEWQAAASMILTHPWLGVGPGNYQKRVGQYYGQVPNATGPAEPDIQNLYLVLGASCGLPALLAFLAVLSTALVAAVKAGRPGAAGAVAAFALTAVWHPLLVRGIGLPLVFVLALSRHMAQEKAKDGR